MRIRESGAKPTLRDVDGERTSGNLLPGEGHVDGVGPLQDGHVRAPEDTVPSVLQDNLHCVPAAVGVHDDDAHVSGSGP